MTPHDLIYRRLLYCRDVAKRGSITRAAERVAGCSRTARQSPAGLQAEPVRAFGD